MAEMKRFWVAAISKPCVDGTVSLELGWFNSRTDCDEFEIVDTIRGFVERVPGWKCGEVKQVKDVEGWPGAPVTLEDVLGRHRRALENKIRCKEFARKNERLRMRLSRSV